MIINEKLNGTAHKMLWAESVHTYEHVQNSMETTGIKKIPFEFFYEEKPEIIGLFLEFGHIVYVTKRENIKKQMTDNTYKAVMI